MKPTTNTTGYPVFDEILERIAPPVVVSKCSCSHANWQHAREGDPRLETEDFEVGQCYVKGCDCTGFDGKADEAEPRPSLAVSQARDLGVQTPHAVLIDQTDTPVALVYGRDETEARARAERAVVGLSGHAGLVAALELVRKMNRYIVELSDKASIDNARHQAAQAIVVVNEALARVRHEGGNR